MKSLLEFILHFTFKFFHTNITAEIIEDEEEEEEVDEPESKFVEATQPFYFNTRV